MKARVQKWGNSLALRIPKSVADEARLRENTPVDISLVEGKLVIKAAPGDAPTLAEMLERVTEENLHGEWNTGPASGKEIW